MSLQAAVTRREFFCNNHLAQLHWPMARRRRRRHTGAACCPRPVDKCVRIYGTLVARTMAGEPSGPSPRPRPYGHHQGAAMNIVWLVGAVVIILAVLSFFGLG
jgi:hypothetical protein